MIAILEIPIDVRIAPAPRLPANWRQSPAPEMLRTIGDDFVASGEAAIMLIPSVILPEENNALINPKHSDFDRFSRDAELMPFHFDTRLL